MPAQLRDRLSGADPVFAIGRVAGTKVGIFERNYRIARTKLYVWVASVLCLGAGTMVLVVSTILEERHG